MIGLVLCLIFMGCMISLDGQSVARIVLFTFVWYFLSFALIPTFSFLLNCFRVGSFASNMTLMMRTIKQQANDPAQSKRYYNLIRLLRSQVYCLYASIVGGYFLLYYKHWPIDLITLWKPEFEIAFEIAIAHWICSLYEDTLVEDEVIAHMIPIPEEDKYGLYSSFISGLYSHHVLTILAFCWSLSTHHLSALCVFGLLFEVPIVFLNIRDIIASFNNDLFPLHHINTSEYPTASCKGFLSSCSFQIYLVLVFVLFHCTRTVFSFLWPLSLIIWRKELTVLPLSSQIVYHMLGVTFCYVNYHIFTTYLRRYVLDDSLRLGFISSAMWLRLMKSKQNREEKDAVSSSEQSNASEVKDSTEKGVGLQLLGMNEISQHNTPTDAWIAVNNNVYDVTTFLEKHPGGAKVLENVLGQDATVAYMKIGHSQSARLLMENYLIGHLLPGGYDQQADSTLKVTSHAVGGQRVLEWMEEDDIYDKPYGDGVDYIKSMVPMLPPMAFLIVVLLFLSAGVRDYQYNNNIPTNTTAIERYPVNLAVSLPPNEVDRLFDQSIGKTSIHCINSVETYFQILNHLFAFICPGAIICCVFNIYHSMSARLRNIVTFGILSRSFLVSDMLFSRKAHLLTVSFLLSLSFDILLLISVPYEDVKRAIRISLLASYVFEVILRRIPIHCGYRTPSDDTQNDSNKKVDRNFSISNWKNKMTSILLDGSVVFGLMCIALDVLSFEMTAIDASLRSVGHYGYSDFLHLTSIPLGYLHLISLVIVGGVVFRAWFTRNLCNHVLMNEDNGLKSLTIIFLMSILYIVAINSLMSSGDQVFLPSLDTFRCSKTGHDSLYPLKHIAHVWHTNTALLLSYVFYPIFLTELCTMLRLSNAAFTLQMSSFFVCCLLWPVAGCVGYARWWTCLLLLITLRFVSLEAKSTLMFVHGPAPKHLYVVRQLEEVLRYSLANLVVKLIIQPMIGLASAIAPDDYKYWMYPEVIFDMGPDCDLGIALQINGQPQLQPNVFQCNVGFLGPNDHDYFRTCRATRDMMQELLDDPEAGSKGFVSDLVALFPLSPDSKTSKNHLYGYREINLSAWASEKAAHDWYKNSVAHKQIIKEYYGSALNDFSAMLASLTPHPQRPIRWEIRCRWCKKMVKGPQVTVCPYCKYEMKSMPYL